MCHACLRDRDELILSLYWATPSAFALPNVEAVEELVAHEVITNHQADLLLSIIEGVES